MPTTLCRRSRRLIPRGILVAAAAGLAGCGGSVHHVKLAGRPSGNLTLPLTGVYRATVQAPLVGPVSARLSASPVKGGFVANSRPGVAWSMIGGLEGFLGPIFAPYLFPGGVIITWESQNPSKGEPGEGWIGLGGIRAFRARTRMTSPQAPVEIFAPDGRRVASMTLEPIAAEGPPFDDYPALARGAEAAIRERLFDRSLAEGSAARSYVAQLKKSAAIAQDDIEFIFGAVLAGRSTMRFSLPLLLRRADLSSQAYVGRQESGDAATLRATFDEQTGIATLKAEAFLDAGDVDRVFQQIIAWNPKGVVIDMYSCPGVTLASLRAASWLVDKPTDAGVFFGPERRDEALAGKADAFPRVEIDSAAAVGGLEGTVDLGAAGVVVMPEPGGYRGPVAVLTSRRTSTSAEPLVWLLKSTGRARVFGQSTAGRPMVSRPIPIGSDWVMWLATSDYSPPVGERISGRGVGPDVAGGREASRAAAKEWLAEQAAKQVVVSEGPAR